MARFVTFITDPELESSVIKAIAAINGELVVRGVSIEQIREAMKLSNVTLICTRQIDFAHSKIVVDKAMSVDEIVELLKPEIPAENFSFNSGDAKVICFVAGVSDAHLTILISLPEGWKSLKDVS